MLLYHGVSPACSLALAGHQLRPPGARATRTKSMSAPRAGGPPSTWSWAAVDAPPVRSPSFSRTVEEPRNGRDKVFHLDWLAPIRIEPRGHGHDGNPSSGRFGSQLSERLDPVDPGEPNVHQDQTRVALLGEADARFPGLASMIA
jgi:hypothetical protein